MRMTSVPPAILRQWCAVLGSPKCVARYHYVKLQCGTFTGFARSIRRRAPHQGRTDTAVSFGVIDSLDTRAITVNGDNSIEQGVSYCDVHLHQRTSGCALAQEVFRA